MRAGEKETKRCVRILFMRSVTQESDITARGRIVGAALELFASEGFRATTLRAIGARAGVSAALVVHHFGGKDGLRCECDARVARFVAEKASKDPLDVLSAAVNTFGPYLARMLSETGPSADALFDGLLAAASSAIDQGVADGSMRQPADVEAQAATLVMFGIAPFVLAHQLARWAGGDVRDGIGRIAGPMNEIYTRGLWIDTSIEGEGL